MLETFLGNLFLSSAFLATFYWAIKENLENPKFLKLLKEGRDDDLEKRLLEFEKEIQDREAEITAYNKSVEDEIRAKSAELKEFEQEHQNKMQELAKTHELYMQQAALENDKEEMIEKKHKKALEEKEKLRKRLTKNFENELKTLQKEQHERDVAHEKTLYEFRQKNEKTLGQMEQEICETMKHLEHFQQKNSPEVLMSNPMSFVNDYRKEVAAYRKAQIELYKSLLAHQESEQNILLQNMQSIPENLHENNNEQQQLSQAAKSETSEEFVISPSEKTIGVIGLSKSGRSNLIGALAGGIRAKHLTSNPIIVNDRKIFKFNHPNNGFINGSIDENRLIYENFFEISKLSNLSALIICSYGAFREEDLLLLCLAQEHKIPTIIVRTKLDEELDNRPENETKEEYIAKDKDMVLRTLSEYHVEYDIENVFNVSAFASILISEKGEGCDMVKYLHDEQKLMAFLHSF